MELEVLVAFLATIAGTMIALFTLLQLMTSGAEYLISLRSRYRAWRYRRTYILTPTIEEIALYSVKEPDFHRPTEQDLAEIEWDKLYRLYELRRSIRIRMVAFLFALGYLVIGLRIIYLGIESMFR